MRPIALLVASAVLLPLVSAAPVPKAAKQRPIYFPTTVGTKWVMSNGKVRSHYEVTAAEEKDGETVVTFECDDRNGQGKGADETVLSADGVFSVLPSGERITYLKLPLKKGDKWVGYQEPDQDSLCACEAVDVERVKVPAGEFDAVRVDIQVKVAGMVAYKMTFWYVPEYGAVKEVRGGMEWVMESFEKGKK